MNSTLSYSSEEISASRALKLGQSLPAGTDTIPFFIPRRRKSNILSSDLGHVDPGLYLNFDENEFYEVTEEHIGRIWFNLSYSNTAQRLDLVLLKARNLYNRSRRYTTQECSSFVIVEMAPFFKSKTFQTKTKKNTSNPDYNEAFIFEIPGKLLRKCALHFMVVDLCDDKRQKIIGHAYYPLKEMPENGGKDISMWRNLCPNARPLESGIATGLINLALHYYDNLERMTITVYEVQHLLDADAGMDIFIKFKQFLGEHKLETKRTSNVRVDDSKKMNFNESFQFKITKSQLRDAGVELSVWLIGHHGSKDRQIGTLHLAASSGDEAGEMWREMREANDKPVTKWLAILPVD